MNSNYYRGELERVRKRRTDADTRASKARSTEAVKRAAASSARAAAARSTNAATIASRQHDAERLNKTADSAAKDGATWQAKAAAFSKQEQSLAGRLARAEAAERQAAKRDRKRASDAAAKREARDRAALRQRVDEAFELATNAVNLRPPRKEKLRILMLGASSDGTLRVGREQTRIRNAVQSASGRDLVQLDVRASATTADLLDGVTRFRPHVIHFSGHSSSDLIAFEDDVDEHHAGVVVTPKAFAAAVSATDDPPLLVVLNACDSAGYLPTFVPDVVPFAIGMSAEIDDIDAINYAAQFYAAIANGQSIGSAHRSGRAALQLAGLPGAELPVLENRSGADPSLAVLVEPPSGP